MNDLSIFDGDGEIKMRVVDLFAGCGGLSLGFARRSPKP